MKLCVLQPLMEYVRSPSSALMDDPTIPIFLPTAPDKKPRTECGCQPVAFISSFRVAPPACFSSSRTFSVLLPSRAPVAFLGTVARLAPFAPFFTAPAFLADLPLDGATRGFRGAAVAFVVAFSSLARAVALRQFWLSSINGA